MKKSLLLVEFISFFILSYFLWAIFLSLITLMDEITSIVNGGTVLDGGLAFSLVWFFFLPATGYFLFFIISYIFLFFIIANAVEGESVFSSSRQRFIWALPFSLAHTFLFVFMGNAGFASSSINLFPFL